MAAKVAEGLWYNASPDLHFRSNMLAQQLTDIDRATFLRDGYLVAPSMVSASRCDELASLAREHLDALIAPVEFEVDVHYPGSPVDRSAPGARTSRRLLQAYARGKAYRDWATDDAVRHGLETLFAGGPVCLSQCHHNCIMTKAPGFSSATLWHQDNRYWSFDREDLITVWLALGDENRKNGCLRVIPGSHTLDLPPGRFDAAKFLRPDVAENKSLISEAERVELSKGDVLFFHSRLFHAAGRNLTDETKLSVVYTYHQQTNHPIEGTRSDQFPSIVL